MKIHTADGNIQEMANTLIEEFGVSGETIDIITDINGWNQKTMEDILYAVSGYNYFGQWEDE